MGTTPEDTEREITQLRGDVTATLEEVERRLRGGLRGAASFEARLSSARAADGVISRARSNPTLLGVAGMVAAGAVAYGAYALVRGVRERGRPENRLKRRVSEVREELTGRVVERVEELGLHLDRARQRAVLLKLEPEKKGFVRVTEARLEPLTKQRGALPVIKKFIWAALLSVFMALGSVLARRVADVVWRSMVHEEPPSRKSNVAS
jgi:hypothetical protein